jgi:hypothetical protein
MTGALTVRFTRLLAVAAIALAVAVVAWLLRPVGDDDTARHVAPAVVVHPVKASLVTTGSCAGRACHGALGPSNRPDGPLFNEYTTWLARDPHAGAYEALSSAKSRAMARQLGIAAAEKSARCLPCHTTTTSDGTEQVGVGCAACHGNAAQWLDAHSAKTWRSLTTREKSEHGLIAVGDPATLARQCVSCHVGAAPADVNHDLIAAGHPRLAFEFSAFFANLPPHWRPKDYPYAQRWAIGQAVTAEAALELLQHRAQSPHAPWPEFAEYDCFGCHHDLTEPSWRQQRAGGSKGRLAWGTWYFSLPKVLADNPMPALVALTDLMEKGRPPRDAVAAKTPAAIDEVRKPAGRFAGARQQPAAVRALMAELPTDRRLTQVPSWDAAEQTYLALWALNRTAHNAAYQKTLVDLLDVRAFRPGWDGPLSLPKQGFDPARLFSRLRAGGLP